MHTVTGSLPATVGILRSIMDIKIRTCDTKHRFDHLIPAGSCESKAIEHITSQFSIKWALLINVLRELEHGGYIVLNALDDLILLY